SYGVYRSPSFGTSDGLAWAQPAVRVRPKLSQATTKAKPDFGSESLHQPGLEGEQAKHRKSLSNPDIANETLTLLSFLKSDLSELKVKKKGVRIGLDAGSDGCSGIANSSPGSHGTAQPHNRWAPGERPTLKDLTATLRRAKSFTCSEKSGTRRLFLQSTMKQSSSELLLATADSQDQVASDGGQRGDEDALPMVIQDQYIQEARQVFEKISKMGSQQDYGFAAEQKDSGGENFARRKSMEELLGHESSVMDEGIVTEPEPMGMPFQDLHEAMDAWTLPNAAPAAGDTEMPLPAHPAAAVEDLPAGKSETPSTPGSLRRRRKFPSAAANGTEGGSEGGSESYRSLSDPMPHRRCSVAEEAKNFSMDSGSHLAGCLCREALGSTTSPCGTHGAFNSAGRNPEIPIPAGDEARARGNGAGRALSSHFEADFRGRAGPFPSNSRRQPSVKSLGPSPAVIISPSSPGVHHPFSVIPPNTLFWGPASLQCHSPQDILLGFRISGIPAAFSPQNILLGSITPAASLCQDILRVSSISTASFPQDILVGSSTLQHYPHKMFPWGSSPPQHCPPKIFAGVQHPHSITSSRYSGVQHPCSIIPPNIPLGSGILIASFPQGLPHHPKTSFLFFFPPGQDMRKHVIMTLLDTEQSYVESLRTLMQGYMKPLKQPENSLLCDPSLVDEIFDQIPELLEHHEQFLEQIHDCVQNWHEKQKVGDLLVQSFSKDVLVNIYSAYIDNFLNAKDAVRIAKEARPAFMKFLEVGLGSQMVLVLGTWVQLNHRPLQHRRYTAASVIDTASKYKLLWKLPLEDVDIVKGASQATNRESIQKSICRLDEDLNTLGQVSKLAETLSFPHQSLDDVIKDLMAAIHRELAEKQSLSFSMAFPPNKVELSTTKADGTESFIFEFPNPDARLSFEQAFEDAKKKLASSKNCLDPEFLKAIPIMKTRSGMQVWNSLEYGIWNSNRMVWV
ncbi:ARHGH factor, partial [Columbina picui]|nr:ARHGH factor [Columbina picui]